MTEINAVFQTVLVCHQQALVSTFDEESYFCSNIITLILLSCFSRKFQVRSAYIHQNRYFIVTLWGYHT
jgi:hypothetical protein